MLVLTRKRQESVVVSSDGVEPTVTVTVLEIFAGKVRLGFEADDDTIVHRWEVWHEKPTRGSASSAA